MTSRFIVGKAEYVHIRGNGKKPFYPIIDTNTGEEFSPTRYRNKSDAYKWADLYNKTIGESV